MPRRLPTLAAFVTLGLFWGAWAAVLPSVQQATGTSKATLGVAMLFVALGALPAMLFVAGPAVDRFGVRAVAVGCAVLAAATTLGYLGLLTGPPLVGGVGQAWSLRGSFVVLALIAAAVAAAAMRRRG